MPVRLAALDLIEVLFHLCREVHVHDVGELLQHQAVHGPAQQGGLELLLLPLHIAAVDDGGDDGGVGGGAADAVLLQRLDEGGFGVAGGGLGELLLALQLPQLEHLPLLEGRKAGLLLFLLVGGLFVQGGETVEGDRVAAGLEAVAAGIDGDGHGVLLAVRHLAGHEAAPDHPVELGGIAADALVHLVGGQARHRGTDGLMGVLRCRGALGLPGALVGADIALAVGPGDVLSGSCHSLVGDAEAVGTHIGDEAHGAVAGDVHAFVQGLGSPHGAGGREAQTAGCLLLQGTGDEGRGGLLRALALFQFAHGVLGPLEALFDGAGLGLRVGQELFSLVVGGQTGREALPAHAQSSVHIPVFLGLEGFDLLLAVVDDADGHALDAARRQTAPDFPPQEGAQLIAHQTVQHTAGLLGVEEVFVDGAGVGHALLHALLGDLIEGHAVGLVGVEAQDVGQMPADGFAFTVRVGRQQHTVGVLGLALQLFDELFLAFDADVLRRIVMLDVDAQLGGGQIADVAHAGRNFVVFAQIFADGLRLGRRLHDDEFCHYVLLLYINPHQPLLLREEAKPAIFPGNTRVPDCQGLPSIGEVASRSDDGEVIPL